MNPFRLKVYTKSPILMSAGYLTLDGLLAVAYENKTGMYATQGDIPLAEDRGIKKGSAAFFSLPEMVNPATFYARMQPADLVCAMEHAKPARGNLIICNQKSGDYKSPATKLMAYDVKSVVWFGVGDMDAVVDLMHFIPGIGRKASLGYGEIDRVEIEEIDEDRSFVFRDAPARPLPAQWWEGRYIAPKMLAVRHPYWSSRKELCVAPSARFFKSSELV